jgi:anti-sigma factor RsiW
LLFDYIDSTLPLALKDPVHEHIEGCPACNPLFRTYRMTVGLRRAIAHLTALPDVKDGWLAATLAEAERPG